VLEDFGQALRCLREAAGMSLAEISAKTLYSKAQMSNIEAGRRTATAECAEACDEAFGTAPLLSMLWQMDHGNGDNVKRRAFLSSVGAVGALGLSGTPAWAEVVRAGLLNASSQEEDWDALIQSYDRRLVTDPSAEYGQSLLAQILVVKQMITERGKSAERLRAVANLGQLYGLWLGNQGQVPAARGWYRTAMTLADQSGDPATRVYVRGRALSRGIYEGYTVRETVNGVQAALALSDRPTLGAMESYSALVHVHALTGNLRDGREAVTGMRSVVDGLSDTETQRIAGPIQRTAHFHTYLESRLGSRQDADAAFATAEPELRPIPVWHADSRIYYGRAQVTAGDVRGGIAYALEAIKGLGPEVHVLKVGVQDLLSVVPAQHRSDELDELRTYAATGPAPWDMVN
jgi:Helix-turn-helix domain